MIEVKTSYLDDGKEDCLFKINGVLLITLHEEGYKALGLNYLQAQILAATIANSLLDAGKNKKETTK